MTRKGLSNLFVLGILTCGVCGIVFSSNGGIVTICVFLGWVCFMAALAFRVYTKESLKKYQEVPYVRNGIMGRDGAENNIENSIVLESRL